MLLDKKNAGLVIKGMALLVALAFILSMVEYVAPYLGGGAGTQGAQQGVSDQRNAERAKELEARLKADPKDFGAAKELGDLYWDSGAGYVQSKDVTSAANYFMLAAQSYEKALKLQPANDNVRTDRATALYYSGDAEQAKKELRLVLKKTPSHANALFNLGLISKDTGDSEGAKWAWERYLKVEPNGDRAAQVKQDLPQLK
ncbi:MAG: hypothetical protein C4521_10805 [Actinobacteria bacterium]|nr:MAG: hypothetical protein C4521_10805 [Actinomycetota bacterium]